MHNHERHSNWLEIDRSAIANNLHALQRIAGTRLMAVVKANAYGHGLVEVARLAAAAGATYLGVARVEEALHLRQQGINIPILVLGYSPPEHFQQAKQHGISLTLLHSDQLQALDQIGVGGAPLQVHVKVDTGMSRLGLAPSAAFALIQKAVEKQNLLVEGVFTHYARADEPEAKTTEDQQQQFLALLSQLESASLRPPLAHAANSAATLRYPESRLDMVRCGIAIYGLHPSDQVKLPQSFQPALRWKALLSDIKNLPAGRGVSYGHIYTTERAERIGVVPVGYGDGFRRVEGNQVLIHGHAVPVIGRVCMDQVMVRLDTIPEAQVGSEVVLLGSQPGESIWAEDIAARWHTINYEVVCGLSARLPRIYQG